MVEILIAHRSLIQLFIYVLLGLEKVAVAHTHKQCVEYPTL